jgi:pimeloyl-ACP methyl ester carboxylesterase/mono/diheme cytochrome c family protein
LRRSSIVLGAALAALLGTAAGARGQALEDVRTPDTPLVLKAQGSFFVGGDTVEQTQGELGDLGPGGHITVNQMYVRYMVPQGSDGNVPVVMVHGATLTGKSWETTPDGRMGWDEYFVRKGHPVYVPDQVGRGRSGFNQAVFNNVRAGTAPAGSLPRWIRFSDEVVWPNFRFGSKPGAPYDDSQFPVAAVDELSKQGVPDVSFGGVPMPNPTLKALSDLAVQLKGAVLMGHSQSGAFPLAAALLDPAAAKGLVLVEPGRCPTDYTPEQIKTLSRIPILAVFGDHRDTPTGIGIRPTWQLSFESCQELIGRIKEAGGNARMLSPAETGIHGNSHMIMQDRNNLQIADLILAWIDEQVTKPAPLALQLQDYAALPITADNTNTNTRAQLARVNFLRDEPGGRRFFVNDLNGPLYLLDKQTKTFTKYLDFNGLAGAPGLFPKFTYERNFATGLTSVVLDPDYARNGVFYTLHMEDLSTPGSAVPRSGVVPGLDLSGYTTTPAVPTPTVGGRVDREVVLVEWTDRNIADSTFEGTARELLRVQYPLAPHPLGEMTFNPAARQGDPDWRVMYLGAGDSQSGEQQDSRRLNPQRLDTLVGKILRIIPDLREHTGTSTVSENGRYRIPNDNPFTTVDGARKEIWAYGLRNPHRLSWDVDPARPGAPTLLAFDIGLVNWEEVDVVHKGANYGWPLREGTQSMSSTNGMGPVPEDDTIPVHVTDTVTRGTVKPVYPVVEYSHDRNTGGDAIAGGFVYRGKLVPALRDKLLFGDITTGRIWYANRTDMLAADDGNAATVAPIHEIDAALRRLTEQKYRERGGKGDALPGMGAVAGPGRVDFRFGVDNDGELYILTKSDGMIRKVVGAGTASPPASAAAGPASRPDSNPARPMTVAGNPVASTPASIAAGKRAYDANCAACHGGLAQGAVKAGTRISIIEEQGGKQPPDLTDDQWDHGSGDGDVFTVIKRGVPPTMMAGFDGRIPDQNIWNIVNYIRSLRTGK